MVAPGLGRPRMALDANPEYMYGTRGRKRGHPHDQFVYANVTEGMRRGLSALQIHGEYPRLAMSVEQLERVMNKIREDVEPRLHGVGRGG